MFEEVELLNFDEVNQSIFIDYTQSSLLYMFECNKGILLMPGHNKILILSVCLGASLLANGSNAQNLNAFQDAYGNMIGRGTIPRLSDKDYFVSQQSNMADRSSVNAGTNPRGNVDVNPPGFIGDNPYGNSTSPNP